MMSLVTSLFLSSSKYTINCQNMGSMPDVTFTINNVQYKLPPSAYVRQVYKLPPSAYVRQVYKLPPSACVRQV